MKRKNATRSALITSIISLLLCVSMLVGTTFAWFTDSVTSANNIIKSGNLDIELEYAVFNDDGTFKEWKDVENQSDILTNQLWEPGVTEIAYLRVANAGSLALKYQLGINIVSEILGKTKDNADIQLSDYIKFGVIEGVNGETDAYSKDAAGRADAISDIETAQKLNAGYTKPGTLYPTNNIPTDVEGAASELYLALVVYMPTTVGNEANHNGINVPEINLGINVFATQVEAEFDSFGNDYDAGAWDYWDGKTENTDWYENADGEYVINTGAELAGLAALVNAGNSFEGKTVKLNADLNLCGAAWTPIGSDLSNCFSGTFDGNGHTISNLSVEGTTNVGLFGYAALGGNVKNLTVKNATVKANDYAGVIMGRGYTDIDNCHVENATVTVTPYLKGDVYDGGAKAGGIIGQMLEGSGNTVTNCSANNVKVYGFRDIGGVVGMVHNNNSCSGNTASNITLGYVLCDQITADKNENAGAIYGRVQSSATVSPAKDSEENQAFALEYIASTGTELQAALKAGGNILLAADIAMEAINIQNPNFVLDGNGYTITQSGTNTYALIDTTGGSVTLKNVTFDGMNGGGVVRTVGAKFNASNVTVQNSNHTQQQGLFRLMGESTIENCVFKNNTCSMAISLNYDGANNDPQIVKDCVFENNTCNSTAVVYYVKGAGCTLTGNKFIDNTVNASGNAATAYMGFTENNVITNNLFQGNDVTGTSKRVAGGLMIGYAAEITGNAFIDNTVTGSVEGLGNDVCASVYYTDIDLSGNYWGGNAPVAGDDYYQEYTNNTVIINEYLTVNPF